MPGRNAWLLARTDRDSVTAAEAIQTGGAVLKRFLGNASPLGSRSIFEVVQSPKGPSDVGRFVIGAARPVLVTASQGDRPFLETGDLVGRVEECAAVRSVAATNPWWVVVNFDWRGPETKIAWPHRAVNALGFESDDPFARDWLLLEARHIGAAVEPDTTLGGEVAAEAGEAVEKVAAAALGVGKVVLFGAGAALVLFLLSKAAGGKNR
jgi:hypothetical protein